MQYTVLEDGKDTGYCGTEEEMIDCAKTLSKTHIYSRFCVVKVKTLVRSTDDTKTTSD